MAQIIKLPFRSLKYSSIGIATGPDDAALDGVSGHTAGNTFNNDPDNPNTGTFYMQTPSARGGAAIQLKIMSGAEDGFFIAFNDVNCFDNTCMATESNKVFMANIVNSSTRTEATVVQMDCGRASQWHYGSETATLGSVIQEQGFSVETISSSSGTLINIPDSVRALFLWTPTVIFTETEIATLRTFGSTGGVIVFIGEHSDFYDGFNVESAFFTGMGSSMTVTPAKIDCGYVLLPETSVMSDPLTSGMTEYHMACSSILNGGTALCRSSEATDSQVIVARGGTLA